LFIISGINGATIDKQDFQTPILDDNLIKRINTGNYPWKAARSPRFEGRSVAEAKRMMGTEKDKETTEPTLKIINRQDFPTQFDSRVQWPGCIHPVLDQGDCGSCWAFGATESLSDRFCIESAGKINVVLSPQSLVSCDWEGNFGCGGGIPQLAWEYMEYLGVLTLDCFPYTSGDNGDTPSCPSECESSGNYQLYYAATFSTSTFLTEWEIQNAIYNDGPVEGTMEVYSDFIGYSSGVYVAAENSTWLGGHAIKIIGWGHDDNSNLDYWIVQNSWGTGWGMNGYFWIQRGVNMCGIDRDASAGKAYLS